MGIDSNADLPKRDQPRKHIQEASQETAPRKKTKLSPTNKSHPLQHGHARSSKLQGPAVAFSNQPVRKPRKRKPLSNRFTPRPKRPPLCGGQDILDGYSEDLDEDVLTYNMSMDGIIEQIEDEGMKEMADCAAEETAIEALSLELGLKRELVADVWVKEEKTGSLKDSLMRNTKAEDDNVNKMWNTVTGDDKDLVSRQDDAEGFVKEIVVVKQLCDIPGTSRFRPSMTCEEDNKQVGIDRVKEEGSDQLDMLDVIVQLQVQNEMLQNELRVVRSSWLWPLLRWFV